MLRVDVEIFSGRPNPTWIINDDDAVREILGTAAETPELVGVPGEGYDGLGYRELVVSSISDDEESWPGRLPQTFALGTLGAAEVAQSAEFAMRIASDMTRYADIRLLEHERTPIDERMRDLVQERIQEFMYRPPEWFRPKPFPPLNPQRTTAQDERCPACTIEVSQFDPVFWNKPQVQPYNNCYNYACDLRTDTFAQPGRAHGAPINVMACSNVSQAALADGLHPRCNCQPSSEKPRRHVALVVWPNEDFHWYREHRGGFWGHKPGKSAARNTDNANLVIANPETCERGPYTDFCDYFYAGRSVLIY